jgi:Predicted Zn-dependent proteases and their inactivated homologs
MSTNYDILKQAVINAASEAGIDEYEIYYSESSNISAETFQHEISGFSGQVGSSINFRCKIDGKMGYASTQLMEESEMAPLIARAAENAKIIESDDEVFIYGGSDKLDYKEVKRFPFTMPDAALIKNFVLESQELLYASDAMVVDGTECGAGGGEFTIHLYNSNGLDLENHAGNTYIYMAAVIDNGEEKQMGHESEHNCIDTLDKNAFAQKVIEKAKEKLGAKLVKSGKYSIVFEGKQMRSLLSVFASAFYAQNVQKGLSLLKGKVGEKIASDCVTIIDTPFYPENTMQTAFDGEGVATYEKNVVENGVLKTFLYNLSSAKKDGVKSTGNASRSGSSINTSPYTFFIQPDKYSRDELLESIGNGLFITELKGLHAGANSVTGDFSIESAGFMVENGKITYPVKSFTVAGNFFDLLKEIDMIGNELQIGWPGFTQIASPDILIRDMSVAGE